MAYAEQSTRWGGPNRERGMVLAREWRLLTRAATGVAILTAPAFFLVLYESNHLSLIASIILTLLAVLLFRALVEVIVRKVLPWPTLLDADAQMKEEDIVARRRYWYWRSKFRLIAIWVVFLLFLLVCCQALFAFSGVHAGFFHPFSGLHTIFPPDSLPQLALVFIQLPLLLFINVGILFGPFLLMAARGIKSYEPGDASWGVKLGDVRGQAEAKEEISRVITLWQSGEEFEKAGGKRERGLLFLGSPGTGKTMISKAIATDFNCPFVTIPGSGFAQMFMGMDAIVVQLLAHRARKLARKWGGQCIVFIDEIDAVGMRRQSLGSGMSGLGEPAAAAVPAPGFHGPYGSLTPSGDVIVESREWRDYIFAQRAEAARANTGSAMLRRVSGAFNAVFPGGMGGMMNGGQALQQLLVVMDGIGEPPMMRKFVTNRLNTFLDALFVFPQRIGKLRLRLSPPRPRAEEIYFIGACNVPLEVLDPALTRPGRMGRHIYFRTPTKDDRQDIFDLYMAKVSHEPDLDTDRRREELARITGGYSPSMIEQCCSMALTIAHSEGRQAFAWRDIVEAMTTVESGTAQNIEYLQEETRAVAIHEAGHAAASHIFEGRDIMATRLSIRKRGGSLGHYMGMEKEERFSHFRSFYVGRLIVGLAAMAAEHVFYGENSAGVGGDVQGATGLAAYMVGSMGMSPDPVTVEIGPGPRPNPGMSPLEDESVKDLTRRRLQRIGERIMNRASDFGAFSDAGKRANAAVLLGQAYVTAYALIATNREAVERIAEELMARKEMHGDEVIDLLASVGLVAPSFDIDDESTWPVLATPTA